MEAASLRGMYHIRDLPGDRLQAADVAVGFVKAHQPVNLGDRGESGLDGMAGQRVKVVGSLNGNTIKVGSISPDR